MHFLRLMNRGLPALGLALCILFHVSSSADAKRLNVLYSFGSSGSSDGLDPFSGLLRDESGSFFGTTFYGGKFSAGTVYTLTPEGVETVLYSFAGGKTDGANPTTALVSDPAGNLYGTTGNGGKGCNGTGCGVVFKLSPGGIETILHYFSGGKDGANPYSSLFRDAAGNLYGTASHGGDIECGNGGCGTVFEIDAGGTFKTLYGFTGWNHADGAFPEGRLLIDGKGNLFGTTAGGGNFETAGTAFTITPDGQETVLHYFGEVDDGRAPQGLIAGRHGEMFGTTVYDDGGGCGGQGCGSIYKLTRAGAETVLHRFNGSDGSAPIAEPTIDARATMYGAALGGGAKGGGVVYKLTRNGRFTVLHNFCRNCKAGSGPQVVGGLVLDETGYLFGTAISGGEMSHGVVYKTKK